MDTYIPKIVHYCWFGPKKMPKKYRGYIRGWKKKLPDYTFILWNEQNFDNGLSAASQEQLKGRTGEEIVDADIAAQMKG